MSDGIEVPMESMEVEPPKDALESANPDPASSLRAAALLTLKSKRRKPTGSQSVPTPTLPIAIDNSVQLDYGQEDSIASSPPQADLGNGQSREEGEISDSEMDPATASAKAASSRPTSLAKPPPIIPSASDNSTDTPPRPETELKAESPPPTLLDRLSDTAVRRGSHSASSITDDLNLGPRSYFIDADHVRPGLEMNQEQYDTAKDIVLDLLGWGVPPEYLVDCGLSREIVFYVFNELNLRLPENLDITGLVPYNPTTAKSFIREPNAPLLGTSGLRSLGHPSLPPKPSMSLNQAQRPVLSPSTTDSSQLNDMERQRRQELLARKAVVSSRKGRSSISQSPSAHPTVTNDQDVEMTPLIPSETVDNFLKSIGSVSDNAESREDKMDVDDIPGLGGPSSHPSSSLPTPTPPPDVETADFDEPPPTTGESALSMLSEASSSRSSASSEEPSQINGRKVGKRPVAADFVDFETAPRHRQNTNGNGSIHPHLKRKTGGSFASISTMRRCVIDLSDSEGEDDGGNSRAGLPPILRRMSVPLGGVGRSATPPNIPQSAGAVVNRSKSPNALAEKEAEIMKMRQMIAARERVNKLKRMDTGSLSGANTPDTLEPIKQEDAEAGSIDIPAQSASESVEQDIAMSDSTTSATKVATVSTASPIGTTGATAVQETDGTTTKQDSGSGTPTDQAAQEKPAETVVDVDSASSSSAQEKLATSQPHQKPAESQEQERHELHSFYNSLFDEYPLLRSRPRPFLLHGKPTQDTSAPDLNSISISDNNYSSFITIPPLSSVSSTSLHSSPAHTVSSLAPVIDLKPLKLARVSQSFDASKKICRYEIPGGGVCRDAKCEDFHLNGKGGKDAAGMDEPNDEDTAAFVSAALPNDWTSAYGMTLTSSISAALKEIRLKNPTMIIEERVARTLAALSSFPSQSTT